MRGKGKRWIEPAAMWILVAAIIVLLAFATVVIFESLGVIGTDIVSIISGLSEQKEVLQLLGIGLGGFVLLLQALIANKRAKAMEETASAQADAATAQAVANQNTETGQRQERLKNAIEHLGSDSESVRLGGAYELFHLANDTHSLRQTVLNILCSHIRRTTKEETYQDKHAWQPSEEIQSLLTLLFVDEYAVFAGLQINLNESWLNGADLCKARLRGANFRRAKLNKALLDNAQLAEAVFSEALLKEARLSKASLREASFFMVQMQGANLEEAQLQGSNLMDGNLTAAYLRKASLQGADLFNASMYGATLTSARIQGARLSWTYLQGSFLDDANLEGAGNHDWDSQFSFAERIRISVGKESDFSKVVDGGILRDRVEQLVSELLCEGKQDALRQQLRPYLNAQHRLGLPGNHCAVIGSYREDEAEDWIAEHEVAMRIMNGHRTLGMQELS